MLLFKNHKAMTLIYHTNQGDNFLGFSEQNGFTLGQVTFSGKIDSNKQTLRKLDFKITAGPQHTFIVTFY
jgi:hypothetical protein